MAEAAELIEQEMETQGVALLWSLELREKTGEAGSGARKEGRRNAIRDRLVQAVEKRQLDAVRIIRDPRTDQLDEEKTYLDFASLRAWARERGLLGEFDSFVERETHVRIQALAEAKVIRGLYEAGLQQFYADRDSRWSEDCSEDVRQRLGAIEANRQALRDENLSLRRRLEDLGQDADGSPMQPTERNSLHKIIAALCEKAGIDLKARAAATPVLQLLELAGTPLDRKTVKRHLDAVAESAEAWGLD